MYACKHFFTDPNPIDVTWQLRSSSACSYMYLYVILKHKCTKASAHYIHVYLLQEVRYMSLLHHIIVTSDTEQVPSLEETERVHSPHANKTYVHWTTSSRRH